VKFYEKGDRPLEVISSRQWFVETLRFKDELIGRGHEIAWHPAFMGGRFTSWVEGLNQDWAVSRQRYFGVPFPVWYRLDADGRPDLDDVIVADESALPVDPQVDTAPGFTPEQRDAPDGFTGDPDIMDTWATSSLTPCASRTRLDPVDERGDQRVRARSGPQEDVEVEGQRRVTDRDLRAALGGRGALLGGQRAPRLRRSDR
jgi:valyl-tRNA synthetase